MPGSHQTDDSGCTSYLIVVREKSRAQEAVSRDHLTFFLTYLVFYENAFNPYLYNY